MEGAPLVEQVLSELAPLAERKHITLERDLRVSVEPNLDGDRIGQVLVNLVGNAIKFTPEGGRVGVRAFVEGATLVTEVWDTGVGIAAADRPRLFERFQQLDMSNTRVAGGTGLGLSITKELVVAHGGTIVVDSAPGRGSTFRFVLPLGAPTA